MTINSFTNNQHLLLKCISGSKAYGLSHKDSDTDIRGVFVLPKPLFFGLTELEQVQDETNDEVYYELKKFFLLLTLNNPNILELLKCPAHCILYRHPLMEKVDVKLFLSKRCKNTFAGYAASQIKKARGLNKKIVNPMEEERKSVLDFCHVVVDGGSLAVKAYLAQKGLQQENCGLVNISNMKGVYALYHSTQHSYAGIIRGENANEVALSSVPKGETPIAVMYFNVEGYSIYCKNYRQYWDWVKQRNETRYEGTMKHGKQYDAKNMMHTFRLLHMAEEIARTGTFMVERTTDKAFLWQIRQGDFEYEDLVGRAKEKVAQIEILFDRSDLPQAPDERKINELLMELRSSFYTS
ncbi:MAG: nucleotidyltransferase domain-containing protein [Saprospiraceae bacterium]